MNSLSSELTDIKKNIEIVKTFGQCCNLVIPKAMANYYEIKVPDHLVLEYRRDGILVRKLVISKK